MPREKMTDKRARAIAVAERMDQHYPQAECALHYTTPFTLTIAVLLSAQTTDASVNKVTPKLFERYPTAEAMKTLPRLATVWAFIETKPKIALHAHK